MDTLPERFADLVLHPLQLKLLLLSFLIFSIDLLTFLLSLLLEQSLLFRFSEHSSLLKFTFHLLLLKSLLLRFPLLPFNLLLLCLSLLVQQFLLLLIDLVHERSTEPSCHHLLLVSDLARIFLSSLISFCLVSIHLLLEHLHQLVVHALLHELLLLFLDSESLLSVPFSLLLSLLLRQPSCFDSRHCLSTLILRAVLL